jgi:hypothetical protein
MSYTLRLMIRDAGLGEARHDQNTVRRAIIETFDWGDDQTDPITGHLASVERGDSPRLFSVNIHRELADDLDVLGRGETDEPDLERALVALFCDELRDRDVEVDLAVRGLRIDAEATTIDRRGMPEKCAERLTRAAAEWKPRGVTRSEDADLVAYARVLARKGREAERGWPPAAAEAYDKAAREVLRGKIARIVELGAQAELGPFVRVLEETLTYAKTIAS